jgi:hypothetical protein
MFRDIVSFYGEKFSALRPTPEAGGPCLAGYIRECSFNIFAFTLRIWKPFHHQPEEASCCGDSDSLITHLYGMTEEIHRSHQDSSGLFGTPTP